MADEGGETILKGDGPGPDASLCPWDKLHAEAVDALTLLPVSRPLGDIAIAGAALLRAARRLTGNEDLCNELHALSQRCSAVGHRLQGHEEPRSEFDSLRTKIDPMLSIAAAWEREQRLADSLYRAVEAVRKEDGSCGFCGAESPRHSDDYCPALGLRDDRLDRRDLVDSYRKSVWALLRTMTATIDKITEATRGLSAIADEFGDTFSEDYL